MNEILNKLYKLIHTPLVTPYNLLENAKINTYNYVKYYKSINGLVCEMECEYSNLKEKFFYHFDENDYLQIIVRKSSDDLEEIIYSRDSEIESLLELHNINNSKAKVAL